MCKGDVNWPRWVLPTRAKIDDYEKKLIKSYLNNSETRLMKNYDQREGSVVYSGMKVIVFWRDFGKYLYLKYLIHN